MNMELVMLPWSPAACIVFTRASRLSAPLLNHLYRLYRCTAHRALFLRKMALAHRGLATGLTCRVVAGSRRPALVRVPGRPGVSAAVDRHGQKSLEVRAAAVSIYFPLHLSVLMILHAIGPTGVAAVWCVVSS
jgi:hypothetical protein